ncbi:MAG: nickel pincer cofactor biosynthesis protein LarB [Candidatus Thermoplasmatota archaeon]|nr:nickel pincer cofactor biosynthesis protein LarB [Candidatus Thermoplasmatota archaeon]
MDEREGWQKVMVDGNRGKRSLVPEAVLALGKDDHSLVKAVESLLEKHAVLVTKADQQQLELLARSFGEKMEMSKTGGCARIGGRWDNDVGRCAVISAGASDQKVADESAFSLEYLGIEPVRAYDRGVAGMHRVAEILEMLRKEERTGVIVIAGMEGALPSVVASSLRQPVIAVPTSIGYGSAFEGLAALLGMLNSCVPGVAVVNIDNGFGAATAVYRAMKTWPGQGKNE